MNCSFGEACGGTVEASPSVGLAVVDSMLAHRIKAFASHAQAFRPGLARWAFLPFAQRCSFADQTCFSAVLGYAGFRWFSSIRNSLGGTGMVQPTCPAASRLPEFS